MNTEQRQYPRYACGGTAEVYRAAGEEPLSAKITEVSVSGCRLVLRGTPRLPVYFIVELTFTVNQLPFRVRGQVRCQTAGAEPNEYAVGLEFLSVSLRTHQQLVDLAEELEDWQSKLTLRTPASELLLM